MKIGPTKHEFLGEVVESKGRTDYSGFYELSGDLL